MWKWQGLQGLHWELPLPQKNKGVLSPCLIGTKGLGPATQTASSSSKSFQASASPLEVLTTGGSLEGTGRKLWGGAELRLADVLGLRLTSGWECSALGRASGARLSSCQRLRGVLNRRALQIQVWRWYLSKIAQSNTSDLHGLMYFGWVVINKKQASSSVCCTWKAFLLCIEWLLEIDKTCWGGPSLTAPCLSS